MKYTSLLAALGCVALALITSGCGAFAGKTNQLQTITLNVELINGVPPAAGTGGFVTLEGLGGTIQLQPMGNYGGGVAKDLTKEATYTVIIDPFNGGDAFGGALLEPCSGPCPMPFDGVHGTVEYNSTGLITAVAPADCSWEDIAPLQNGVVQPPAWFYSGDYMVTASYGGITSQPVYIPVASSAGNQYYPPADEGNPAFLNNPTGACGPSTSGG